MSDVYKDMDELSKEIDELEKKLTPEQDKVATILCDPDIMDNVPAEVYNRSVEELNEYFGGHEGMMIDETVRKFCITYKQWSDMTLDMVMAYHEMGGETNTDGVDAFEQAVAAMNDEEKEAYKAIWQEVMDQGPNFMPEGFFTKPLQMAWDHFKAYGMNDKVLKALSEWEKLGYPYGDGEDPFDF